MKAKINKLIPLAVEAIRESKIADYNDVVKKEFKGYISSMGASILQAGLLPTIAFFANDEGKKAKSSYLLKAVHIVITDNNTNGQSLFKYVVDKTKKDNLPERQDNKIRMNDLDMNKLYLMEEEISDALIAIKLALRTFKLKD